MPATRMNLTIEQGATFKKYLTWKAAGVPVNLTGATARLHVRAKADTTGDPLLALTTENGGIALGGEQGTIELTVEAAATAAITAWRKGVYDLEIQLADGFVKRLTEGTVEVSPEVTRA